MKLFVALLFALLFSTSLDASPIYGLGLFFPDDPSNSLASGNTATNGALTNRAISGAALLSWQWNVLEPIDGMYNFSSIDAEVAIVEKAGKKFSLGIEAGQYTPTWLYVEDSNSEFPTVIENGGATSSCGNAINVGNPFNTTYQTKWLAFVAALASHVRPGALVSYANDPNFVDFKASSGINFLTNENILPFGTGNIVNGCQYANDTALWPSYGYNGGTLVTIFTNFLNAYHADFPNQYLDVMTGNSSFPCIDDTGTIQNSSSNWCSVSTWKFYQVGFSLYPTQFIASDNNLIGGSAINTQGVFLYMSGGLMTGWQFSQPVVNDVSPSCYMNAGVSPCPHYQTMLSVIANATLFKGWTGAIVPLGCHPIKLEPFAVDIVDTTDYTQSMWDSLSAAVLSQITCPNQARPI